MEYPEQRKLYIAEFKEFSAKIVLNTDFISLLIKDTGFGYYMRSIKGFSDERKKDFVLLELTNSRRRCEKIISFLEQSGQKEQAKALKEYNTPPHRKLSYEIEIYVYPAEGQMGSKTLTYRMSAKPRGKAIIINNMRKKLSRESKRFKHIFTELLFDVDVYDQGLTVDQIKKKIVHAYSTEAKMSRQIQATIVMILSHGANEKICGIKACAARNRAEQDDNYVSDPDYKNILAKDMINISDIVGLYSETNAPELKRTAKLFFFTCCRTKIGLESDMDDERRGHFSKEFRSKLDQTDYRDTFVFYSCSEGRKTNLRNGFTYFGQALSHSIAEYAAHENLATIMTRTNQTMSRFREKRADQDEGRKFDPEFRSHCVEGDLYFNPKWSE